MSQTETPAAAAPTAPPDPIVTKSYSVPIALSMLAVVGATVLVVADEMYLRRPYKAVQGRYQEVYSDYLARVEAKRRSFVDNVVMRSEELAALRKAADEAAAACAGPAAVAEAQLESASNQARAIVAATKVAKSEISALTYEADHKAHADGKKVVAESDAARPVLDEIAEVENRQVTYSWTARKFTGMDGDGKPAFETAEETETDTVKALLAKSLDLEAKKAEYQIALGSATKARAEAFKKRDTWIEENLADLKYAVPEATDEDRKKIADMGSAAFLDTDVVALKPDTIAKLREKVDEIPHEWWNTGLRGDIRQIHVAEAGNWVDRCETCHLNARSPLPVTAESLRSVLGRELTIPPATEGGEAISFPAWPKEKLDAAPLALFASHPNADLLKTHDPERFGCSMCHNGNGVAVTSTDLAHGLNKHWLQPLFPKEHVEAGCVQCHQQDLVLANGDRINEARDTFRRAGCWGCHKYAGFNEEVDRINELEGRRKAIGDASAAKDLRIRNLQALCATLSDDPDALAKEFPANKREQDALIQEISALETESAEVVKRLGQLHRERQRVGPNLKDVKIKLRPEFLTEWVKNPREAHKDASGRAFRPETKMPAFRWANDEEVKDVAAYLSQSAIDPSEFEAYKLPAFVSGDAKRGEELFTRRGCLVCHSMGTGADRIGNDYAANLSNLGEKNRPEYVARWVTHPRQRLVPYDISKKKDVAGGSATDPNLVWTQPTIMPDFRLSESEVRDITTYLTSQKRADVKYEEPTWLADPARFERGKKLVVFQGCAGCHEIRGLEDEKGIGTGLTAEGSKPLEQFDFGHHTIAAERGVEPLKEDATGLLEDAATLFTEHKPWYRPRGFVLHKIAKPDVYDDSKFLPDRFTRLRMPQFRFTAQEITDVTTLVIGSVDSKIPKSFRYNPDEAGRAIREGWWVVKKYNCQGCHQVLPTDTPALWKTPFYADKVEKLRDQFLPPTLVGVGLRLRPEWMAKFLRDPSLGGGRAKPASVRAHLETRMPTFDFSDDEIQKLVLFFQALAKQPSVYQPPVLDPLSPAEKKAADAIWKSANCMQCHVVDGMAINAETKAPNLTYGPARLRPEWMRRWIANPPGMNPATAMTRFFGERPAADGKWHFMTKLAEVEGITADHVDLMVRYVAQGLAGK